jgi:xyloglucan-specific endo-beta-1,4-glucanase
LHSTLFQGLGPRGQNVLSWIPDKNQTHFDHDLAPLIEYLWKNNLASHDTYVGTVAFGMESFFSTDPVTFSAYNLSLAVNGNAGSSWRTPGVGWSSLIYAALVGLVPMFF